MSRKLWIALLSVAAVAGTSLIWSLRDDYAAARATTGYAAKEACSCVHVSGRALDACMADLPAGDMRQVNVSQTGAHVRASILFGAIGSDATYEEGFGCQLVD